MAKKRGRPKGSKNSTPKMASGITIEDIQAVKALADRLGAEKLKELAKVLAK